MNKEQIAERAFKMSVASVYVHYIAKVEKKGRTKAEVDEVIYWLTGYDESQLIALLENKTSFRDFFDNAPLLNPNSNKITGTICGYKIQEIEDPLMKKMRYLDKLVDEIAQGKAMNKILRE